MPNVMCDISDCRFNESSHCTQNNIYIVECTLSETWPQLLPAAGSCGTYEPKKEKK